MARFWKALFAANSSFSVSGSSLAPLINLISGGAVGGAPNFTTAQLQTELDKIKLEKAKKYKNALKILIDDYEDVCYTAVDEFKPKESSRPMNVQVLLPPQPWGTWAGGSKSGYVQWDSGMFELKAKVFHIVPAAAPATRWEVGFVQHCTLKANNGTYSNGDLLCDHPTQAAPWCDSGQVAEYPWYTKGIHNGLTAWATLATGVHEAVNYGMNDSFNGRKHPYLSVQPATGAVAGTKLTSLDCQQDFTTWLCRYDTTINARLLLKKVSYSIRGRFSLNATNQQSGTSNSVRIGSAETPDLTATLPNTNVQSMNNAEQWFSNGVQL
jgi:hypothetical protein